jgi:DNA-binding NarL/FixJ family response regulator
MVVLLLSDDLMLGSQLAAAAQQSGQTVRTAANLDSLLSLCAEADVRQVVLDLNVSNVNPATALPKLRDACPSQATFLAIAPHVHTAKIEAAKQAGFDRVLTRGQFHGSMMELFVE